MAPTLLRDGLSSTARPHVQSADNRFYRPELDVLRFLAFAWVFWGHSPSPTSTLSPLNDIGAFGLCLFFMLSAYLIISLLLRERAVSGTINVKSFALRRVLRIWPLYFLGIALGCASGIFWPDMRLPWQAVAAMVLLSTNFYVLAHGWVLGVINPLWSIALEEQFYLVIPWVARFRSRRILTVALLLTIAVAEITLFYLGRRGASYNSGVWPNSFVQFQFFATGGLIALWNDRHSNTLGLGSRTLLYAVGVICWLIASIHYHLRWLDPAVPHNLLTGYGLVLIGTTAMFFSFLQVDLHFPKSLVYLGRISFGLYVYHSFLVRLVLQLWYTHLPSGWIRNHPILTTPIVFAATVGTAALSYKFFERPILLIKQRFETVRTRT